MYMAPLNYDRFFKKIFSDTEIAKSFLEDFLDVEIETIEKLGNRHAITNKSKIVEFDYRCKIQGQYIIIDMQQWYKSDIAQRFYIYHALNSALQLEDLKEKVIQIDSLDDNDYKIEKEVKDYRRVEPVLTLIWMVDDSLHFKNDFITYKLLPEILESFLKNDQIWFEKNFKSINQKRLDLLNVMDNSYKDMDFLKKNKLIFMLQKNIVENLETTRNKIESSLDEADKQNFDLLKKDDLKYWKWFNFAKKTLKKDNSEEDFIEYKNDPLFKEIMRRLAKDKLSEADKEYIVDESDLQEKIDRYNSGVYSDGLRDGLKENKNKIKELTKSKTQCQEQQKELQNKDKELQNNQKELQNNQKELQNNQKEKINMILELNKNNIPINIIAISSKLTENEVNKILNNY